MEKRNYPLILIDRSKPANYPNDYIVCLDREVGFVARVVPFFENHSLNLFIEKSKLNPDFDYISIIYKFRHREGGVILAIDDFLHNFEIEKKQKNRLKVLLKKALKKYLHAEVERTPKDDLSIENQIKQQQLTVERAKSNYDDLLLRANGDKELADYQIALVEATLETLKVFKDNQNYLILNLN